MCNGGWEDGAWFACCPSCVSVGYEEESIGCMAERGHSYYKGVGTGILRGGYYMCSGGDRSVVQLRPNRVGRVLCELKGVQTLKGRWKACSLHVGELVRENGADGELVVHVVWEVHKTV